MEKTRVKVIMSTNQCRITEGMEGYIDGYVRAGDDRPYACVVAGNMVDMIPMYALEILNPSN